MSQGSLKNMVVLKNLPSNIVEEAIVILRSNKKIKAVEKIDNKKMIENSKNKIVSKDYIIKEAEMLITDYISILEKKKKEKNININKIKKKYTKVRNYAYISSLIILLESIIILIK